MENCSPRRQIICKVCEEQVDPLLWEFHKCKVFNKATDTDPEDEESKELIDSLKKQVIELSAVVATKFAINSREYELLAKAIFLMNRAAHRIDQLDR